MVEIPEAFNYGAVRKAASFEKLVDKIIKDGDPFGFDIETGYFGNPTESMVATKTFHPNWVMAGFSFTNSLQWARYVPVAHDNGVNVDDVPRTARALWRLLQTGMGVPHNAAFELRSLARWFRDVLWDDEEVGAAVREANGYYPIRSDTMIETFLYQEYDPKKVGQKLKSLVEHIYGHKMVKFEELFDEMLKEKTITRKTLRFNILPPEGRNVTYACEDSLWALALHLDHYDKVKDSIVFKTEMALLQVCAEMEEAGVLLDWATIQSKDDELLEFTARMNEEIQQAISERLDEVMTINLNSPQQVAKVLYERLGLPILKYTDTGNAATDSKTLKGLAQEEPIVAQILRYREAVKLHGSYLGKYLKDLHYSPDGRAFPNHKQTGTTTGRFSVDEVPYQQWPKPYYFKLGDGTTYEFNFRDLMLAPQGYRIVGFDYSQVEMRVLAGVAQEAALIDAFARGEDLHRATASKMLGIPLDEVTDKDRSMGKTLNFAIVYGSTAKGIAEQLVCSVEEAQEKLDQYFKAFPQIKKWVDSQVLAGRSQGYVQNLFGRKVTVWDYREREQWKRNNGDRFCGNAPIQGGAADYFKIAMVRANRAIKKAGWQDKVKMVITFHDALEFYVHESLKTEEVIALLGPAVSYPMKGLPEIKADWHEGYQWGSIAEIDLDEDGNVASYSRKVELHDKTKRFWEGETLEEVLTPFYYWASPHFGHTYHGLEYYLSRVPEARDYTPTEEPESAPVAAPKVEEVPEEGEWPKKAVVTLSSMPRKSQWVEFRALLSEYPGDTKVEVETPQGNITFDTKHQVTKNVSLNISVILDGAKVTIRDDRDASELLEEMELV